ncbi:D-alanyl-lipoteichoic acid biosynthesis protein DltD [Flavobacterium sp.]|uniref:D-alanyl-lipoteichoic acid biosynthesis protein DltD n=1 Tax=Flavobacterium sp. TaxID=239 RepID=UPI0028BE86BE|nr:D-alanyl-lipoteichoic acid biosynthesis protein DltD [Flavobacterium sp.]
MKILLKKIFLFVLPFIGIFLFIEGFYRFVPNDYTKKRDLIEHKKDTTEVLIFGNSHPFYGLNPKYFNKPTFNLSYVSQTIYFDKLLFDKHIDKFKNVDCVILHIEYTSLSEVINTDENNWRKYYYESYMNLEVPSIVKYDPTRLFLSSTRNFNNNIKILSRFCMDGTLVNCDENGFGINYTPEEKQLISKEEAQKRVNSVEDHLMDFTDNTLRIQAIIDACKKRNIEVVLLTLPVTDYFSENVNQEKLAKIIKTCNSLTENNENVSYLNLFKDNRFSNADFYDSDHLHTNGAIKSSKIVNQFVNGILQNKKRQL